MDSVLECVVCSDPELDSHRFMDMVDEAIEAGTLKTSSKYKKWCTKVSKRKRPANPLKPKKVSKKQAADDAALVAAIQKRVRVAEALQPAFVCLHARSRPDLLMRLQQKGSDNFLAQLEAKYTAGAKTGRRGKKN